MKHPGALGLVDAVGIAAAGHGLRLAVWRHTYLDGPRERRQRLRERIHAKRIAGAGQEWRRLTGRAMTTAELERVIWRYPGDV